MQADEMGHAGRMLNLLRDDPEKRTQIENQIKGETPIVFQGYVRAANVDMYNKVKEALGGEPGQFLVGLKDHFGPTSTYTEHSPVAAWLFSPAKLVEEIAKKNGAMIIDDDESKKLHREVYKDLKKLGVHVVIEENLVERNGVSEGTEYIGVPVTQPIKNADGNDFTFVKDTAGIDTLTAYLLTKTYKGHPLAKLEDIMDARGYGYLMDVPAPNIINPENIQDKKLQADFKAAYERALENEPETATRILAYHMALNHITPEVVEQGYSAEMKDKVTSIHTENWIRSLTGKPPIEGKWTKQYTSQIDHKEHQVHTH